jgi:hypothetical protein
MKRDLNQFLIFYNFNRGHGGLRKEIKVRTPYEALEYWYNLKPDLFISLAVLTITNMHHSLLIQINKQGNVIMTFSNTGFI